jgi:hypothetical protein
MNKYFRIGREKEHKDIQTLIEMLRPEITSNTIIVNCSPDYSSIISQQVAHAYFDNPLTMLSFEMPYPNTEFEKVYEAHCREFAENLEPNTHYVFIDSGILRGRNFKTLYDNLNIYAHKSTNYHFACLYCQDDAIFNADYCVDWFNREEDGMLNFWWESDLCNLFD